MLSEAPNGSRPPELPRHAKPLVVGFSAAAGSEKVLESYGALAKLSQSFTGAVGYYSLRPECFDSEP